jgi:hypothetical protein
MEPEPPTEHVSITCTLKHETGKAILVQVGSAEAWLPKSLIEFDKSDDGTVVVRLPKWLADERGLTDECLPVADRKRSTANPAPVRCRQSLDTLCTAT